MLRRQISSVFPSVFQPLLMFLSSPSLSLLVDLISSCFIMLPFNSVLVGLNIVFILNPDFLDVTDPEPFGGLLNLVRNSQRYNHISPLVGIRDNLFDLLSVFDNELASFMRNKFFWRDKYLGSEMYMAFELFLSVAVLQEMTALVVFGHSPNCIDLSICGIG